MTKPIHLQIKDRYQLGAAYHLTHGKNLAGIFGAGEILSKNRIGNQAYVDVSNPDVQEWRSAKIEPNSGLPIHNFVPLYFGFKTPMVACLQHINEQIVFLRFSLDILDFGGVVVCDGNARADRTQFRLFTSIDDLEILDRRAILSVKWARDDELRRKKQAEILVPNRLSIQLLLDIIVFSEAARRAVQRHAEKAGIRVRVRVNSGWYFTEGKA